MSDENELNVFTLKEVPENDTGVVTLSEHDLYKIIHRANELGLESKKLFRIKHSKLLGSERFFIELEPTN